MDIIEIIKNRKTIRRYQNRTISKHLLDKIIEAGRWGSSLHSFQPWEFIIVTNKTFIGKLANILYKEYYNIGIGIKIMLNSSALAINNAQALIIVYNSGVFTNWICKLKAKRSEIAKIAEISAISAAIQNMVLTAESLGISSSWLTTPLLYTKRINKLLNTKKKLIAVLTLGYSAEKGKRSRRNPISKTVKFMK